MLAVGPVSLAFLGFAFGGYRDKRELTMVELGKIMQSAGLENYVKDKLLGSGRHADVYQLHDKTKPTTLVALKLARTATSREALKIDVKVLKALHGDGFPQLIYPKDKDIGLISANPDLGCYLMSVAGPDVGALLWNKMITRRQAQRWIIKVANAILKLHKKGYAHNDLFHPNICVSRENQKEVILIDLGDAVELKGNNALAYLRDWTEFIKTASYIFHYFSINRKAMAKRFTDTSASVPKQMQAELTAVTGVNNAVKPPTSEEIEKRLTELMLSGTDSKEPWFTGYDEDKKLLTSWKPTDAYPTLSDEDRGTLTENEDTEGK